MNNNKSVPKHPYFQGNFAPTKKETSFEICEIEGKIPDELIGGQYVRNGGNPLSHSSPNREMHWFDGHGMLSSVYCKRKASDTSVKALYSNKYVRTDVFIAETQTAEAQRPILLCMATLLNPDATLWTVITRVLNTIWAVLCSFWRASKFPIKRISVANTNIVCHQGRVLATCESGPPMRVLLPGLQTVGWFNGCRAEGESSECHDYNLQPEFGGTGVLGFFREWTTGHPHIDPVTGEMMLFHSTFVWPFVRYSVLNGQSRKYSLGTQTFNRRVPGILSPKVMHDLGVSRQHTIIIDMPLSLNPMRLLSSRPAISFDPRGQTRFGIFPRHMPQDVQWLSTGACCIFHTVDTWDTPTEINNLYPDVNMLVCRLTGPSIMFEAADIPVPSDQAVQQDECTLYYYKFSVCGNERYISQQWALSAIPFEFPHVPKHVVMSCTNFVYGCSVGNGESSHQRGKSFKIGSLVKVNVHNLITRGIANPPVSGYVDDRTVGEILSSQDPDDTIQIFPMPSGWYAQECTFLPRQFRRMMGGF